MSAQKVFSCLIVLAGLGACLSGVEGVVSAELTCEMTGPYSPAICTPAYQRPPSDDFNYNGDAGCEMSYLFWCVPIENTGCTVTGYGFAMPGACSHYLGETNTGDCYENYFVNTVKLQYHRDDCQFFDGNCQCVFVIGEKPPLSVANCDCVIIN